MTQSISVPSFSAKIHTRILYLQEGVGGVSEHAPLCGGSSSLAARGGRGEGTADRSVEEPRVDGDAVGGVVGLVDAYQPVCQLEHVVSQGDDDELGVLGPLLDVVGHDRNVFEVLFAQGGDVKERKEKEMVSE